MPNPSKDDWRVALFRARATALQHHKAACAAYAAMAHRLADPLASFADISSIAQRATWHTEQERNCRKLAADITRRLNRTQEESSQ